ncbi:MAG: ECF transporter S component [Butyrivibrio sp.]|uniref:ECF transporter S component n=1 Tax=Butyrivibrio sp. TaxID=28121 RepID=UPI0025F0660F|nr:ECF transporter S component [Butyrivibrio sp.]MCR5771656.1 ECF transporter S component [Butyrivibrio sp.]
MNITLLSSVVQNTIYVSGFVIIIAIAFIVSILCENLAQKINHTSEPLFSTRKIVVIGTFAAISVVLMMFEIALPFAPSFYKMDLSDLPALIGAFAFGPMAGVMIELVKILLELVIRGTSTAFVGELANFVIGCCFVLPASIIYTFKKTRTMALIACLVGTIVISIVGSLMNAFFLLPAYSALYGMPVDAFVQMGNEVNGNVTSIWTLVLYCVVPLNLLKGGIDSIIAVLIYKRISVILKTATFAYKRK